MQNFGFNGTVHLLFTQEGLVRQDEPGHEHFGFKDGVSQPGIRGVDTPRPGGEPNQGNPGQDLLWPGEFVLGYQTQIDGPDTVNHPPLSPNPNPGPVSQSGPAWAADGSYLVFRRLQQDVAGFHAQLHQLAPANGLDPRVFAAKLVGRYDSGCPLEPLKRPAAGRRSRRMTRPSPRTRSGTTTSSTGATPPAVPSHAPRTSARSTRATRTRQAAGRMTRRSAGCCGAASRSASR